MPAKTKAVKRGENEVPCGLCGFKPSDVRPSARFVCGICTPLGALGPDRRLKQKVNASRDEVSSLRARLPGYIGEAVKRAQTMAEIAAERRPFPIHKSYGERDDLRLLAVCNNINGPIAPSGLMTLDDSKVTCKRCLRIMAGKPVGARI